MPSTNEDIDGVVERVAHW